MFKPQGWPCNASLEAEGQQFPVTYLNSEADQRSGEVSKKQQTEVMQRHFEELAIQLRKVRR